MPTDTISLSPTPDAAHLRDTTLAYVERMRAPGEPYGRYSYAEHMAGPVLYASSYAAMTRHLFGELDGLGDRDRRAWIAYLQAHQDDDGLFRDPAIYGEGWYKDDPEWCGRRHLSCHVVTALTCLGAVAEKRQGWLAPFIAPGGIEGWLEQRAWRDAPAFAGNEVMNVGTLLQYARDFQGHPQAGDAMRRLLAWLASHHLDAAAGVWGYKDLADPLNLSDEVQAAYHFWPLFFYDHVPVPYPERAIDTVLRTQNPRGGFGWGVHNRHDPWNSSACEDIDSIDPLARLSTVTSHRRDEIRAALRRALPWVLSNQNPDGGFVFMRGQPFAYGHPLMASGPDVSAMFPTWFRTLCLAILAQALPDSLLGEVAWQFCECPGMQFWRGRVGGTPCEKSSN
jgi:hypothetical protein